MPEGSDPTAPSYARFVAVGDSFTEGLDDPVPGDGGRHRGWADLVASALAAVAAQRRPAGTVEYANLAVRGRLLREIVEDQLPLACSWRPDLLSLAGGTNDLLRRRCEPAALARLLHRSAVTAAGSGARLVLFTGVDPARRLPLTRRLSAAVHTLNAGVRWAAADTGAALADVASSDVFDDPRLWSDDRLHLNAAGHARVAAAVLEALEVEVAPATARLLGLPVDWRAPLPPAGRAPRAAAVGAELRWVRTHLAPWVHRRVTGRSSGDSVRPKRPSLTPVALTT